MSPPQGTSGLTLQALCGVGQIPAASGRADPKVGVAEETGHKAIVVPGICSLKQLTVKFNVGKETREAKTGWGIHSPTPTLALLPL